MRLLDATKFLAGAACFACALLGVGHAAADPAPAAVAGGILTALPVLRHAARPAAPRRDPRDLMIDELHSAYIDGRIDEGELERRVDAELRRPYRPSPMRESP